MAKNREKKTATGKAGEVWSRFGLQAVLVLILGLAALSFITLGVLRRGATVAEPPTPVPTAVSGRLEVPSPAALPPAAAETPPAPAGVFPAPSSGAPIGAGDGGTTGGQVQAQDPAASSSPFPPPTAVAPAASPAAAPAAAPFPAPPGPAGGEAAGQPQAAAQAASPAQKPMEDAPPFPPPGRDEKKAEAGFKIPEPMWQSVDQKWDQVNKGPDVKDETLSPGGASWKQLDVGQAEQAVESQPKTVPVAAPLVKKPEPVKRTPAQPKAKPKNVVRKKSAPPRAEALRLSIINESGLAEAAEAYRTVLQNMGYVVGKIENGPVQAGATLIFYQPHKKEQAGKLYQRLPGEKKMTPLTSTSPFDVVIQVRGPDRTVPADPGTSNPVKN
ncbi:MAG: LytR C-terminal domain-containing protein [Pseudomonadota bacterium]